VRSYQLTVTNVGLALTFNGIGMLAFITGLVEPIWAMIAIAVSVSVVLVNSSHAGCYLASIRDNPLPSQTISPTYFAISVAGVSTRLINSRTLPKQQEPCGLRKSQAHCPALMPVLMSSTIALRDSNEAARISPTVCRKQ
jgi:hypothetical protein